MAGLLDYITEAAKAQYAKGAPYRNALGGLLSGDMSGLQELNKPSPVMPNEALDVAMTFAPMGITAWHGSPYKFDKFDPAKIGSGEGAQAYGHGLYFAERPEVAASYMPSWEYKEASNYLFSKNINDAISHANRDLGAMIKGKSPQSAIDSQNSIISILLSKKNGGSQLNRYFAPSLSKEMELAFQDGGMPRVVKLLQKENLVDYEPEVKKHFAQIAGEQSLYKVDISDKAIPKMLNWDKPLGKQNKSVTNAINNTKKYLTDDDLAELGGDVGLLYGKDITPAEFLNTWEIIRGKPNVGESLLNEQGVKGVKYFDNASREKLKGTRNFVVFDPDIVKILERN